MLPTHMVIEIPYISPGTHELRAQPGYMKRRNLGAHGVGETPVPIPNTEVKPYSGYNTALRENSTVPVFATSHLKGWLFAFEGR